MAGKIQQQPSGLLQFLRIYSTGKQPDLLEEQVKPVVDLSEFYASRRLEVVTTTTLLAGSGGDEATLTIPSDETWRVHNVSGKADTFTATGNRVFATAFYRPRGIGQAVVCATTELSQTTTGSTGDTVRVGAPLPVPPILAPGGAVGLTLDRSITGTCTLTLAALIERLVA